MVVFGVFEISEKNVPPKIDFVAIPGVGPRPIGKNGLFTS
jgi:hypothetical protein